MNFEIDPKKSIRSQIVEHFRAKIRKGGLKPGDRLPSARELAGTFGTAESNVHHALAALVKEGLLTRRPKAGTVVTTGVEKLTCAAIYLSWLFIQRGENFTRLLIEMLEESFSARGIRCMVIYDTPSQNGLEQLKKLAENRQIQGVIVRNLTPDQYPFFARLPIPFSALTSMRIPNRVSFFSTETIREIATRIRRDGIRQLGILAANQIVNPDGSPENEIHQQLFQQLQRQQLHVRPEWIFDSSRLGVAKVLDSTTFAYTGFQAIWQQPEHPEAFLLFSDDLVSGLAMAFYRYNVKVPEDIRLYIHKTRENELVLPFPCTLLENRIHELAETLVQQLVDQSEGRPPTPGRLSLEIRDWRP